MRRWRRPRPASRDRSWQYRRAGFVALLALSLTSVAVFVRQNPLGSGYEIRALFTSASQLRTGSEVRIAGIKVGQVDAITHGPGDSALVTMGIDAAGRPVHTDATLTVKPRLILEGNGYVDLHPGTPGAPELRSGATLPLRQTAVTVQLDEVLDALDLQTRSSLTRSVAGLASGLASPGFGGLRQSVRELDGALADVSAVSRAARGTTPEDLRDAVGWSSSLAAQLAENPAAIAGLLTSYRSVSGALAAEDRRLASAIVSLDGLLRVAPRPLRALDAALPSLTGFARSLRPALRAAPRPLVRTAELLDQVSALTRPVALPALLRALAPVLSDLPAFEIRLRTLFGFTTPVTDCITSHVVPTLQMKIQDGPNTTGDPVYLDGLHLFAGLTGLSSAVDGNGGTVRLGVADAQGIVDQLIPGAGLVVGKAPAVLGVRPAWLGSNVDPAFRPDQPCARQPLPDLSARAAPAPDWARGGGTR